MVRYRVDELADAAGISVELLRSYQSRGLLPPPRHEGRLAFYDQRHLEQLKLIRDLKSQGYSLRMVAAAIRQGADSPRPLVADIGDSEETLTLTEVAERTGMPPAMLRSLEASGVITPRRSGVERRYTTADVWAVRMLLSLLGSGMPMEEFMEVARVQLATAQEVAHGAVDLFLRYVRAPLQAAGLTQREEADRLVAALRLMIHASTTLMTYNFQRMVLNAATETIEREGTRAERTALAREVARRRFELGIPA
jgi:DNA-binding transcriptional MerR regulator